MKRFKSLLKFPAAANNKNDNGCLIIGEVAQAHDGSLGTAHAFIDAIADAGADAVKFQTHIASAESTPEEPWRIKFSRQDATRYDYWKRMEFSKDQWHGLRSHADERGLLFLSSPFSVEAVDLLNGIGISAWKLASGEITNQQMLEKIVETKLPVILSTGMSNLSEIDNAVKFLQAGKIPLAVLQCTSLYPCPPEKVGLNLLSFFRERYGCAVGLSDHSGRVYPGLAAAVLGADVVEVHVTLSREMFGPDVIASVTTSELHQMVEGIRFIEKMLASPLDKNVIDGDIEFMRGLFTKSVVAGIDIPAGTILKEEHLAAKKPGTGIPADRMKELIGLRPKRNIKADELIRKEDLEVPD